MKRLKTLFAVMPVVMALCTGSLNAQPGTELIISEIMYDPNPIPDFDGWNGEVEWFEVQNRSDHSIDLNGMIIAVNESCHTITTTTPLVVPSGGFVVFGNNADMLTNGGVHVDYEYSNLYLFDSGFTLSIHRGTGTPLDGAQIFQLPDWVADYNGSLFLCPNGNHALGVRGSHGTPGGPNDDCSTTNIVRVYAFAPLSRLTGCITKTNDALMIELINQKRAEYGLPPLLYYDRATLAANDHAQDMVANGFFGHTGSDGSTYQERGLRYGFNATTEFLAMGPASAEHIVPIFFNDPAHLHMLLDSMSTASGTYFHRFQNRIGIAKVQDGGSYKWCIVFGYEDDPNPQPQSQTISFDPIEDRKFNDPPVSLAASASSGLSVAYEIVSGPGVLTNGQVVATGTGQIVIRASQEGNESFLPAPIVTRSFEILKGDQVISFTAIDDIQLGAPVINLTGSSDSGLPLTYYVSGPAIMLLSGVLAMGSGTVTVVATQAGNENYNSAHPVIHSFIVNPSPQGGTTMEAWFADLDHDGYGDMRSSLVSCFPVPDHVQNNQDCNDSNASIFPGATEVDDGNDNNCDGQVDEGFAVVIGNVELTPVCADVPILLRRWKLRNPNAVSLRIDWEIIGTIERSWLDIPPGDSYLTTIAIPSNPNTLKIYWHDEKGAKKSLQKNSITTKCARPSASNARPSGESDEVMADTNTLKAYPNPGRDRITLEVVSDEAAEVSVQIVTTSGVVHKSDNVRLEQGTNFFVRDISELPSGAYVVKVKNQTIRFIKE